MAGGKTTDLQYATWQLLCKLTAENISDEHLTYLMRIELGRPDDNLGNLNQAQAEALIETLMPLSKLRKLLWEAAGKTENVTPDMADEIATQQCNALSTMLLRQANFDLFGRNNQQISLPEVDA